MILYIIGGLALLLTVLYFVIKSKPVNNIQEKKEEKVTNIEKPKPV
jgi:hypothetical protein